MVQMYSIQPEKYNEANFKELFVQMTIKFILLMLHLLIQFIYQPFHQNTFLLIQFIKLKVLVFHT